MAKKPVDPRGGHSRVYWEIQDSMAWRALSFSSVALYMALRRKLQATNNGNIEATIATLRHAGFKAPATLAKGLRELRAVGLLDQTRQGGVARGKKACSLYRFTDECVFEHPKQGIPKMGATNDWRAFSTLPDAARAIEAAHAAVKSAKGSQKKVRIQKLYRANTDSVLKRDSVDTDSVLEAVSLEQKLNQYGKRKSAANPQPA